MQRGRGRTAARLCTQQAPGACRRRRCNGGRGGAAAGGGCRPGPTLGAFPLIVDHAVVSCSSFAQSSSSTGRWPATPCPLWQCASRGPGCAGGGAPAAGAAPRPSSRHPPALATPRQALQLGQGGHPSWQGVHTLQHQTWRQGLLALLCVGQQHAKRAGLIVAVLGPRSAHAAMRRQ